MLVIIDVTKIAALFAAMFLVDWAIQGRFGMLFAPLDQLKYRLGPPVRVVAMAVLGVVLSIRMLNDRFSEVAALVVGGIAFAAYFVLTLMNVCGKN